MRGVCGSRRDVLFACTFVACAFVRDCVCVVYTELCVISVSYFVMLCGLRVASLCGCCMVCLA